MGFVDRFLWVDFNAAVAEMRGRGSCAGWSRSGSLVGSGVRYHIGIIGAQLLRRPAIAPGMDRLFGRTGGLRARVNLPQGGNAVMNSTNSVAEIVSAGKDSTFNSAIQRLENAMNYVEFSDGVPENLLPR